MNIRSLCHASLVSIGLLFAAAATGAESVGITSVDPRTGVVKAEDSARKRTIQFTATPEQIRKLRVGQMISVDYDQKKATIDSTLEPVSFVWDLQQNIGQ
jgi:hypothetical protein